jgi:bacillithiol biosynthesis deacetylase BshB1
MKPLDVLAIGAHPDDAELSFGGTLALLARRGRRVGILDLTRGERGSRGTAAIRAREGAAAARALRLVWRGTAGLPDTRLEATPKARERVAALIRRLRPDVVLTPASDRRNPDHSPAETLAHDACFTAGLRNAAVPGAPFRPRKFLRSVGYRSGPPGLLVDITPVFAVKLEAVRCHRSQFEPDGWTVLDRVEARARYFGALGGVRYAEGFVQTEPVLMDDLTRLAGSSF